MNDGFTPTANVHKGWPSVGQLPRWMRRNSSIPLKAEAGRKRPVSYRLPDAKKQTLILLLRAAMRPRDYSGTPDRLRPS